MFTVNIRGERDPKNIEMVKLTMVFYKSGYTRVTKVLHITAPYCEWNKRKQMFNSAELSSKNKLLQQEKLKYLKVAEKWEYANKNWIPVELSHYFDNDKITKDRYITIEQMIDKTIHTLLQQERYKNGRIFTSVGTASNYTYLKTSLQNFTKHKYRKEFVKYMFRDIDEKFLRDYVIYEQQRGAKNGTNGGIQSKLKYLRAICAKAKDEGVYNVDILIFNPFKHKIKGCYSTPKSVSYDIIRHIESVNRSILNKRENLYLDLFLFSFYACGMSPIDICFLEHSSVKEDMIIYERIKIDKITRAILTDKAKELIGKYHQESYMNFVFPIIKKKQMTQAQQYGRVERIVGGVNKTLKKICAHLNISEHITWSCARSSFISKMVDEGYHPLQIAE